MEFAKRTELRLGEPRVLTRGRERSERKNLTQSSRSSQSSFNHKEHKEMKVGRLRLGGSTSASTAGVLACQWNKAPLKTSATDFKPQRTQRSQRNLTQSSRSPQSKEIQTSGSILIALVFNPPLRFLSE